MTKKPAAAPLAIVLSSYTSGHFGHIDGYIALAEFDGEHPGSARYDAPDEQRLRISSQCDDAGNRLYGYQVRFDPESSRGISTYDAERAVRVLKRLERRLEKLADQYGSPATFGQYILAVARALGATVVYVRNPNYRAYYEHLPLTDPAKVVNVLDYEVAQKLVKQVNPKADVSSNRIYSVA